MEPGTSLWVRMPDRWAECVPIHAHAPWFTPVPKEMRETRGADHEGARLRVRLLPDGPDFEVVNAEALRLVRPPLAR